MGSSFFSSTGLAAAAGDAMADSSFGSVAAAAATGAATCSADGLLAADFSSGLLVVAFSASSPP